MGNGNGRRGIFRREPMRIIDSMKELQYLCEHTMECRENDEPVGMYKIPMLTWQMSEYLLSRIDERFQRQVKEDNLRRIGDDMSAGNYMHLGEPIRINGAGYTIDGRNRLTASSGRRIDLTEQWLSALYEKDVDSYIDSNSVVRSVRDCVRIIMAKLPEYEGKDIRPLDPQVIRAIIFVEYKYDVARESRVIQAQKVVDCVHIDFVERRLIDLKGNGRCVKGAYTGLLAGAYDCSKVDEAAAERFFSALFTNDQGVEGVDGSFVRVGYKLVMYARTYDARPLEIGGVPKNGTDAMRLAAAAVIDLWNAWRLGNPAPIKIRVPKGSAMPKPI